MTQEEIIAFLSDRLADLDASFTFVVESARSSENYEDFRRRLDEGMGKVEITQAVNVGEWLRAQTNGYVVYMRRSENDGEELLLDDTGLPVVYATPEDAFQAVPTNYELVRIFNLREDHEKRQAK